MSTLTDPRSSLAPGVYRAAVVGVHEGWVIRPNGDPTRGIVSIEYSLPGCGDWRWSLHDDSVMPWGERAPQDFLVAAAKREWFEFERQP